MITAISIEQLTKGKVLRLSEPGGLELRKQKSGLKWYGRFKRNGVLIQKIIGTYPEVSIADARAELKRLKAETAEAPASITLRRACELWIAKKSKEIESWERTQKLLERHVISKLGAVSMADLTAPMLIKAWSDLEEAGKMDTIKRLCQYMRQISTFVVNTGRVEVMHNLSAIGDNYPAPKVTHRATIPPSELTNFFRTFYSHRIDFGIGYDLLMATFYTLLRQQEVTRMEWDWIKSDYIEIPAGVMKMKRPHRVPISKQLNEVFNNVPELNQYVFASPYYCLQGKPVSKETLNKALRRAGFKDKLCAHGIRAIGSTWFAQQGIDRTIRESCLAHITGSKSELAYQHYDFLEERRPVMQQWCDFVEKCSKEAQQNLKAKITA